MITESDPNWMDDFVKSGTQGLKSNSKDLLSEQNKQISELQQVIGEQAPGY